MGIRIPEPYKRCRAAILAELQKPLALDPIELPELLKPGQVLVQVKYSGICGSQLGEMDGVKGHDPYLPHLLGHEGAGEVLVAGPGVKFVKPGDAVVMHWRKGAGIDAEPPAYRWQGRPLNAGFVTTFNELAVVSENRLTPVPGDFDLSLAALFGCAVTTGFGVVQRNARLRIGESIVVMGAGGIGLNIVQAAAMTTAHPIVGVDLYDSKLALAEALGATHVFNARRCNVREEVLAVVGDRGADVVVDNTGNPDVIETAYETTRPGGRTILVGVPRKGDNISIYSLPLHFGKVLTGSHGGEAEPASDIPRFIRLHRAGKLKLAPLITDRFPFERINTAIERMRNGEIAGRCVIAF